MNRLKKAYNKLDKIVEKRGGFLPEADHEYDDAVVNLINVFTEVHDGAFLIQTWPVVKIKKIKPGIKVFNGINQYKYVAKNKETVNLILKEYKIDSSKLLDKIHEGKIDAEYLMWT